VRGTGTGAYEQGLVGNGVSATVTGADTKPGQVDHLVVRPGQAQLGFSSGGKRSSLVYELAAKEGKATRTATVALTARSGGHDQTSLASGTLSIAHDGPPTTATVTLGSVGDSLPGGVQTAPVRLGAGQTLALTPRSWKALDRGARYAVRARGGKVVRRGSVKLRASAAVAVRGVFARRKGSTVTVRGRVTRRGHQPVLAVTAEVVHGGKVLRRRSVARDGVKAGRFSVPVKVGALAAGARVRVIVSLVDQSPGLATVRRTVRVR
jgi:hypothetical protein